MKELKTGRRKFMLAGVTAAMATFAGTSAAQQIETETDKFRPIAHLYGPIENLPTRESGFFDDKPYFGYVYYSFSGERWYTTSDMSQWKQLRFTLPKYSEGDIPAPDNEAELIYNTDRRHFASSDSLHWHYPVVVEDVTISPTTVSNTTVETLLYDRTISPDALIPSRVFELSLFGKYSVASTNDVVTINVYLGGSLLATVASAGRNASDAPWYTKVTFTVRSQGTNGQVQPHALAKFNDANADDHEPTRTVDTTVSENIDAYAQWNNAKTGNSITLGQAYLKEVA